MMGLNSGVCLWFTDQDGREVSEEGKDADDTGVNGRHLCESGKSLSGSL
jgi:hypothetical protein